MEIQSLDQLLTNTFPHVTRITISAELRAFPKELFRYKDSLEILDLSNNLLESIPDEIVQLKKLRILFLSNNRFTQFPVILGQCQSLSMIGFKANQLNFIPEHAFPETLQWLILTDNRIETIPASIGKCKPLEKVAFAGNQLKTLPEEMANCKNLALLRISANAFEKLPSWLLSMPKLAWLAYSGNPCSQTQETKNLLPEINWNDLKLLETLGEGASGIIFKAELQQAATQQRIVALKLFKGEVTSDGYAEDEMALSSLLPVHENLVRVLGKLNGHPDKKDGLIFELIPAGYRNLGLPPSFSTCSRDTFKEGTQFKTKEVLSVLKAIANVCLQLHTNGVMHGDLYTHNTLINESGHPIFGDFGAATAYTITDEAAKKLERIEVRAFGYMADDLLQHVHPEDRNSETIRKLVELKKICLMEEVLLRPDFKHVVNLLEGLN
jgi:hypothetical protein